ncbi:M28 family metallopeptidase [Myroides sp. LJL116]
MRIIIVLVFFMSLLSCGTKKSMSLSPSISSEELISKDLYYLTSDELLGREAGTQGADQASNYLIKELEANHIKPLFNSYKDTLSNYANSWNVVGVQPGKDNALKNEIIVLGAHFDHIGVVKPIDNDSIANGANDNASGSVILLDQVRRLSGMDNKRTIVYAFFNAEEKGLLGSEHLALKMKESGLNVVLMLNFEMLGVPMDREYITYGTGLELSNVAELINNIAQEQLVGELPLATEYNLFKRSDNYPFYKHFDVPSHTFCSFDFENYPYYHHVLDHAELMDVAFMASFSEKMAKVINKLVNMPQGNIRKF